MKGSTYVHAHLPQHPARRLYMNYSRCDRVDYCENCWKALGTGRNASQWIAYDGKKKATINEVPEVRQYLFSSVGWCDMSELIFVF